MEHLWLLEDVPCASRKTESEGMSNLKLLLVLGSSEAFYTDASERELNEILATTDKSWQVHLAASRIMRYDNLTCDYKSHRVPFVPAPDSILSRSLYVLFLLIKSVDIVKKCNIDAIMAKSGHLILGFVAYLASRMTNRKCIIRVNEDTILDIILFIKTHRIPLIGNEAALKMIEKVCRRIEEYLFKHVDWIVTHGPMDYERIKEITGKVTFIPLWVDTQNYRPVSKVQKRHLRRELLGLGNVRVALFVGRLHSNKDPATLFFAFKRLLEVRNDVILVVIGTGPEKKKYVELVKQLDITDKVKLLGYIRHEEIPKYYNIADVYVLTSIWEEWSNTIMEAMACGVPVIATNVGANPYLVKDGETGFLFPRGDFNALAEKMAYVLDHPSEVKRISARARLSVKQYTKRGIGESYQNTIQKVITGK